MIMTRITQVEVVAAATKVVPQDLDLTETMLLLEQVVADLVVETMDHETME